MSLTNDQPGEFNPDPDNLDIATAQIVAPSIGPTRTEDDIAAHIAQTVATDPEAVGHLLPTTSIRINPKLSFASSLNNVIFQTTWALREKHGILLLMASHFAFLADSTQAIRFAYTPKHSSWLNQIEIWLSILVRRVLKRSKFLSAADLRQKLLDFSAFFNKTAKPFKWTYAGRPLHA